MVDLRAILSIKRDGGELTEEQIHDFLDGYAHGSVPDYHASAMLMAVFLNGLGEEELEHWTRAMLESGERFDFGASERPLVDKHSTGGIGDKASLPLAPALAACGAAVPMISGRGLGHTGGTLDKLESIPGFRTLLTKKEFRAAVETEGLAIAGQTDDIAPVDRKLYALRDVTGLVDSIPLIASSILSKKLAEGIDALVLDVKYGSGAFIGDPKKGRELARTMIRLAKRFDLGASALLTAMDRPLGRTVGHALEVREALDCLGGDGPEDLRELSCALGGEVLTAARLAKNAKVGAEAIGASLDDGTALERFRAMIANQGGDPRVVDDPGLLPKAPDVDLFLAEELGESGFLQCTDARAIGYALTALGGGRRDLGDAIDPAVGFVLLRLPGEEVSGGEAVVAIHHRAGRGLAEARELLRRAFSTSSESELQPLILARITS